MSCIQAANTFLANNTLNSRKCTLELSRLKSLLDNVKARTTPIIGTDINDEMGTS